MQRSKNIPTVNLDKLSYVAIPLKILSNTGHVLGICTGFIYKRSGQYYLITNWHCFTGKHPETGKPINDDFVLPAKIQIPFHKTKKPFITWERHNFKLIDKATNPKWLIHPIHKQKIDVVALKLKIPTDIILHPINGEGFDTYKPMISDNVFILGFPYNIKGGGNFPIWKKASISTEPDIDYNSKPQILVDTASRKGMSGAPVIFRRTGIHGLVGGKPVGSSVIGEIQNFLGVYSGRYTGDTDFDAQLGIIWKAKVIDEIIDANILDTIN